MPLQLCPGEALPMGISQRTQRRMLVVPGAPLHVNQTQYGDNIKLPLRTAPTAVATSGKVAKMFRAKPFMMILMQ